MFKLKTKLVQVYRYGFSNPDDLRWPVFLSILLHALLILVFSFSDLFSKEQVVKPKQLKYIKTIVVNKEGKLSTIEQKATKKVNEDRVKQIRRKEEQQKSLELERIAAKKAKLAKDKSEQVKLEQQKLQNEQLKKKQEEEKKQKQADALKKKNDQAKRLAEEQAKKAALQKQKQAREAKLQQIREDREKREALIKKRAELEQIRNQVLADQDAPILDEYESQIQIKISQSWSRPLSARNGMKVTLQINLIPGGEVSNVSIVESSGDEAFDLSATQAVWNASPLPVPNESGVFARNYRVFNLLFSPEDLWQ